MKKTALLLLLWVGFTFYAPSESIAQNSDDANITKSPQRLAFEDSYHKVGAAALEAYNYQQAGRNKDSCESYRSALSLVHHILQSLGSLVLRNDANGAYLSDDHDANEEMGKAKALILDGIKETCGKENTYTAPVGDSPSGQTINSGSGTGGSVHVPYNANNAYTVANKPADGFDFNGALRNLQATIDNGYNASIEAAKFYQSSQSANACQSAKSAQSAYEKAGVDARDILGRRNYARYINIADIDKNAKQAASDAREFYCK